MTFSAVHTVPGLPDQLPAPRLHGHDFTATFLFEATDLAYPGVVVDADMRAEIIAYITHRLAHLNLDDLLPRNIAPTCEAIAAHLATWHHRSARVPGHAHLITVTVTTGAGGHGEVRLANPSDLR